MLFCFLYNVVSENHSVQNSPWGGGGAGGSIASSRSKISPTNYGHVTKLFVESEFQHKLNKQAKNHKLSAKSCGFLGRNRFRK